MAQLNHFSHRHLLSLVQLQSKHNCENSDDEVDDENEDDFVQEEPHVGKCNMCEEEIYTFHKCYYDCNDCDYSLHKFCAQLPETKRNHPLHPGHSLMLSKFPPSLGKRRCSICKHLIYMSFNYYCSICAFTMDIICCTMLEQKMDHPSHPHKLQRFSPMIARCNACGSEHSGTFFHCTTCISFRTHLDCALLPPKLLIQESTNGNFSHSHPLTLAYCFLLMEKRAKFFPRCRVCEKGFDPDYMWREDSYLWHYRCDKCRYYIHVDCATSRKEAFMSSIFMPTGSGKTYKNFKDEDHPNLICCPFPDESVNLVMQHFINKCETNFKEKIDDEMFSHPHPLVLVNTLLNDSVTLHDPMKKVELLCDGCVRPITDVPFYKCSQNDCGFVLHEWCTRLPSKIHDYRDHPEHTLVLIPKVPGKFYGLFWCSVCNIYCNGFAYGCMQCEYYVDIHCCFVPDVITHEGHANHILIFTADIDKACMCNACGHQFLEGFHCPTCDFYLHIYCALLLPRTIRHKYDNHPLSLQYHPAENHSGEYFCEICEDELNPEKWFYYCSMCASSMHTACAPLKLRSEQSLYISEFPIFGYLNIKFGGRHEITNHPHSLTFVQGIEADGKCMFCDHELQYEMILKCIQCKFAVHYLCGKSIIRS